MSGWVLMGWRAGYQTSAVWPVQWPVQPAVQQVFFFLSLSISVACERCALSIVKRAKCAGEFLGYSTCLLGFTPAHLHTRVDTET